MMTKSITRYLLAAGLAVALVSGPAYGQEAGQDVKDAGHATKDAAVDTGHATKDAAKDTGHATKRVYHKTKRVTKRAAKTTAHRTENAGDAIAGKPAQH
jgi:gas vesicle protein